MKLDDKIRNSRIAYLLKGEASTAFELALLYFILAKRRTAADKIADACLKSAQWLQKAGIDISVNVSKIETPDQLELIEKVLVQNRAMICYKAESLVRAIPIFNRDFVLRSST